MNWTASAEIGDGMNWLWDIFGNDDSWPPPDWFTRKRYWMALIFGRKLGWLIRNPFHNLTRYKWGLTGEFYLTQRTVKSGEFYEGGTPLDTWNPKGGHMWGFLFQAELERFPFHSYRGKYIEYYYGWRPNDGAFGMALRRVRSK